MNSHMEVYIPYTSNRLIKGRITFAVQHNHSAGYQCGMRLIQIRGACLSRICHLAGQSEISVLMLNSSKNLTK